MSNGIRAWFVIGILDGLLGGALAQARIDTALAYVPGGHAEQVLDVYWPDSFPKAAVLFVHGGSLLEQGERRDSPEYHHICSRFVSRDVACVTMDYRLYPSFQWPAMPEDVAAAIVTTRQILADRGTRPENLFLFGHSSGCQLVATVAANEKYLRAVDLSSEHVAGTIPMGCILDSYDAQLHRATADRIEAALDSADLALYGSGAAWIDGNPAYHVTGRMPPTLVVVAERERFFPPILEQGSRFVRRLLELSVAADIAVVPGTHRSSIQNFGVEGDPTIDVVMEFIERHRVK